MSDENVKQNQENRAALIATLAAAAVASGRSKQPVKESTVIQAAANVGAALYANGALAETVKAYAPTAVAASKALKEAAEEADARRKAAAEEAAKSKKGKRAQKTKKASSQHQQQHQQQQQH